MSVNYEVRNDRVTAIINEEGDQIGVLTNQPDGQFGYSIFGTHHRGAAPTEEEAKKAIEQAVSA